MKSGKTREALNKLQFYLFCCVVVTLLGPMLLNNIVIILLLFVSFVKLLNQKVKYNIIQAVLTLLFAIGIVSVLYSESVSTTLKGVEKSLSLLIFPLIFSTSKLTKKQLEKILLVFAISTLFTIIIAIIISIFNTYINGSIYKFNPNNLVIENLFRYHKLSENVNFHPTYLSIYTAFAMIIFGTVLLRNYQVVNSKLRLFSFIALVILGIALFALNTFSVIFSACIFLFLLFWMYSKGAKMVLLSIILLIGTCFIFYSKARNSINIGEIVQFSYEDSVTSTNWNSVNSRLALWSCSLEVVKENLPFGVGKGNSREYLLDKYQEKGFVLGSQRQYTSHNMYLTYAMEFGVLGLLLFIILILLLFLNSIRNKSILLLGISTLFAVSSLTEEVFELNKGIVFFSFFCVILTINSKFELFYEGEQ
ncbi:O-antigen ligase family protein [Galbibacter sp.]|uniref:O-antigen ligase family protein n=1 Tax=Galbibacter sp. TaxID=2918471 RepID=UPI003A920F90